MKTFFLFAGNNYYPQRFDDYKGKFHSVEAAIQAIQWESEREYDEVLDNWEPRVDWAQIVELAETGDLVLVKDLRDRR